MIKKTIKIPLFWKIYITVVTIILIGFVVLWSILWTALKKYEQSRPEYAMDKITEQIQLQDTGDFTKYVHTGGNAYEGSEALDEAVREYIKNVLCEGEWAYTKTSGEYTNDNPVYQLKKDGQKTDIIIYLEKNSKNEWTIADVSGLSCEGKAYEIIVPENSEVTVDGNKLGSEYVTETKDAEVLSNVAKHINMPKTTTYHIENVYKEHEIKATGPVYNSELELISSTDNVYEFGFEANGKLIEEQESRIKEITEIYGKYVVNYEGFAKLSPYIRPGSYAYSYLSRISKTNIWLEVSREPAFNDMKVYNYQSYTKDCFSCEVSFDLQVSYNSGSFKDYPTHMEYIFVKRSGKWYIADMVMLK